MLENHVVHQRFGHPSTCILSFLFPSMSFEMNICHTCQFYKKVCIPFNNSSSMSFIPFMLIHSNLWGPCCIDSYDGFKYFVLFIDDYSRTTWIFYWSTRMKFILFSRIFVSCWWFSLIVKSRFFIRIIGLNLQRVLFFPFFPMKALFIKLVVFFGDYKIFHGSNECAGEILVRRSCNICVLDK